MTPDQAAELLDHVLARAERIKAAGLRRFNVGVASFEFGPDEGGDAKTAADDDAETEVGSLADLIAGAGDAASKKERPPL